MQRAGPDRIQRLKRWQVILFGDDRSLIHVLVADEEKQTILDSWSTDPDAGIPAGEERILGVSSRRASHLTEREFVPRDARHRSYLIVIFSISH